MTDGEYHLTFAQWRARLEQRDPSKEPVVVLAFDPDNAATSDFVEAFEPKQTVCCAGAGQERIRCCLFGRSSTSSQ